MGKSSGKALHYKSCRFHRIVKGFVVQGGDIVKGGLALNGMRSTAYFCECNRHSAGIYNQYFT